MEIFKYNGFEKIKMPKHFFLCLGVLLSQYVFFGHGIVKKSFQRAIANDIVDV